MHFPLQSWSLATYLETTKLSLSFPNLVHNITYGSPIGNPLPLSMSFLPSNLPSANIRPKIIDQELVVEVAARWMSGPFTVSEATEIFSGFFCCSPVGLVEKVPGDGNWCMIRHLSKQDSNRNSTNDWLNSDDFPTTYFTSTLATQFVSFSLLFTPLHFCFVPHLHSICGLRPVCQWCTLLVFAPIGVLSMWPSWFQCSQCNLLLC